MKVGVSEMISFYMWGTLTPKTLEWAPSVELKTTCRIRQKTHKNQRLIELQIETQNKTKWIFKNLHNGMIKCVPRCTWRCASPSSAHNCSLKSHKPQQFLILRWLHLTETSTNSYSTRRKMKKIASSLSLVFFFLIP